MFIGFSASAQLIHVQTPDEVRAVLHAWNWEGNWFQDCDHPEFQHLIASLSGDGFPTETTLNDGKKAGEFGSGHLVSANVGDDGTLDTVTELRVGDYLVARLTKVEIFNDNSLRILSAQADIEATADVPPHVIKLWPDGTLQGTRMRRQVIKNSMLLDTTEIPTKPAVVYHRCGRILS